MKKEIQIFFTAVMYFTRIPCPKWIGHSQEYLTKCSRYFPLVGIIIGAIGGLVYYGCSFIFPHAIAILLSMISTILVTGAFHEDGLADMFDGFGGGWKKDDILRIMKDSRIGTYGVVGLCSVLALKFCCLFVIDSKFIFPVSIVGHSFSRFVTCTLMYHLDYVRDDGQTKPNIKEVSLTSLITAAFFGITPLVLLVSKTRFPLIKLVVLLIAVLIARWYLGRFFKKWIGGQTGDCCGATQQIGEVVIYLSLVVVWKYI